MEYVFTENQVFKLLKAFYGPLKKREHDNYVAWKNTNYDTVFMFIDNTDMSIDEDYYFGFLRHIGVYQGSENYNVIWNIMEKYLTELAGKRPHVFVFM